MTFFPIAITDPYNFGAPANAEFKVEEIVSHRWKNGKHLEFEVLWDNGEVTWEPLDNCQDLVALDNYLKLKGKEDPQTLPKPRKPPHAVECQASTRTTSYII